LSDSGSSRFIDVHQHGVPQVYRDALARAGLIDPIPGVDYPDWSVQETLAMMDRRGIGVAVLSITEPGLQFAGRWAKGLAREVNEYLAELVRELPHRFGAFAVLPLPDVDDALDELGYALDVLGLDGVGLMSNYGGVYPGDASLDPLFAELGRRRAPVFVHPSTPPGFDPSRLGLPVSLYEFTFDTTRMVANLLYSGTLERHPELVLILSHAGGTVPFLASRLTYGSTISSALADRTPSDVIGLLRRLYYDTAMSVSPYSLPSLQSLVDPSHILLGTDFPFMPEQTTIETLDGLGEFDGFDGEGLAAIMRDNALELFPRLRDEQLATV
jgi:predicted TIM-barrel fold metal-dependent hydrolase